MVINLASIAKQTAIEDGRRAGIKMCFSIDQPCQGAGVVNGFACYLYNLETIKRMSSDAQVRILSLTIPFTFLYGFPTN